MLDFSVTNLFSRIKFQEDMLNCSVFLYNEVQKSFPCLLSNDFFCCMLNCSIFYLQWILKIFFMLLAKWLLLLKAKLFHFIFIMTLNNLFHSSCWMASFTVKHREKRWRRASFVLIDYSSFIPMFSFISILSSSSTNTGKHGKTSGTRSMWYKPR